MTAKKKGGARPFRQFISEVAIPTLIYMCVMPKILPGFWENVADEPWYVLAFLHVISIIMCVCWINAYSCFWKGVKPPKRPKT